MRIINTIIAKVFSSHNAALRNGDYKLASSILRVKNANNNTQSLSILKRLKTVEQKNTQGNGSHTKEMASLQARLQSLIEEKQEYQVQAELVENKLTAELQKSTNAASIEVGINTNVITKHHRVIKDNMNGLIAENITRLNLLVKESDVHQPSRIELRGAEGEANSVEFDTQGLKERLLIVQTQQNNDRLHMMLAAIAYGDNSSIDSVQSRLTMLQDLSMYVLAAGVTAGGVIDRTPALKDSFDQLKGSTEHLFTQLNGTKDSLERRTAQKVDNS